MNIPPGYQHLEGSERQPAPGGRLIGPADPNEPLSVTIVVRRRSPLPALEYWRTTPPQSHKVLTREEFAANYGAAPEDLQRVSDFVRSRGLTVEETSVPRRTVVVSGTAAQFNDAFAVELGRYESPHQTYRGHEGSLHVPAELVGIIEGVFGLDNRRTGGRNSGGGGLTSTLTPAQVALLYNFPAGNATGQTIGILAMEMGSGYTSSDLQAFFTSLGTGFTPPSIVEVNIDNASNTPGGSGDAEVLGDICVASTVAQGATIALYFAPWTQKGWVDAIGRAIHPKRGDPTPSVLSTSWFMSEGDDEPTLMVNGWTPANIDTVSALFLDAAHLGITVFAASGDSGSDGTVYGDPRHQVVKYQDGKAHVQYPGSDPWVTSCGGTIISNVEGLSFTEKTWNDSSGATGGGVSDHFRTIPFYQTSAGVPPSVNDGHQGRGVPDIAGNASLTSGYQIPVQGTPTPFDGTSAVAPLYAGLIAVINAMLGRPTGFLNPMLYAFGAGSGAFNDINDGTSNARNGALGYPSGPGWDACTGWGRIDGYELLNSIRDLMSSQGFTAQLSAFWAPNPITCGYSEPAQIFIASPALAQVHIQLTSDEPALVSVPSMVTIPVDSLSTTFNVTAAAIPIPFPPKFVNVHATYAGQTLTMTAEVVPPTVQEVTVSADTIVSGGSTTGTVFLTRPSLNGQVVVDLSSDTPNFASVLPQVTIQQDALSSDPFVILAPDIATPFAPVHTKIYATYAGRAVSASLTVNPRVSAGILRSLTLFPSTVKGGATSRGTVTLEEAVPMDTLVALAAVESAGTEPRPGQHASSIASVPASVTIRAGAGGAEFTIRTAVLLPRTTGKATIIAGADVLKYAELTVTS